MDMAAQEHVSKKLWMQVTNMLVFNTEVNVGLETHLESMERNH
jgi:hypothetical protein